MTKLMYAAWGDDLTTALTDSDLRAALAEAGAQRLQVNLADDAVAEAMSLATEQPVEAVVGVWLPEAGDPAAAPAAAQAVTGVLRAVTGRLAGWVVEERMPIPPPVVADGERTDAMANLALLRRPAELDEETWRERWLVDHTPVAIATQGTFGYVQNIVRSDLAPLTDDPFAVDALVEELFAMAAITDIHAFYGSGGDDDELGRRMTAMMASIARFGADRDLDLVPTSRYGWTFAGPGEE